MSDFTKVIHSKKTSSYHGAVNTPVHRASTFIYPNVEEYLKADNPVHTDKSYGRSGTPSMWDLANEIAELEGAPKCIITSSGMSAIVTTFMALLKSGEHVLICDALYKCTRRFVEEEFPRFNISYTFFPARDLDQLPKLVRANSKIIFFESPGSGTFEILDIERLVQIAKDNSLLTVMDNSWGTGALFKPFKYKIDVSVLSLTKYVSGHSDVLLGAICCKPEQYKRLYQAFLNYSPNASADYCYLVSRGLKTLKVRLQAHQKSAIKIAKWLKQHKLVQDVFYPALPSSPDYALWKKYYSGANGLLSFVLKNSKPDYVYRFIDKLKIFSIGLSWGGYESLVIPYNVSAFREGGNNQYAQVYIRMHVGLEDCSDLINDLKQALDIVKSGLKHGVEI